MRGRRKAFKHGRDPQARLAQIRSHIKPGKVLMTDVHSNLATPDWFS